MKKTVGGSLAAKCIAFLLAMALFTALCCFALCYGWAAIDRGYRENGSFEGSDIARQAARYVISDGYWWIPSSELDAAAEREMMQNTSKRAADSNIRYECKSRLTDKSYAFRGGDDVFLFSLPTGYYDWQVYRTGELTVRDSLYYANGFYELSQLALNNVPLFVLLLLCEILLTVFLAHAAGRRNGVEGFVPGWQERIPSDLFFVLYAALILGIGCCIPLGMDAMDVLLGTPLFYAILIPVFFLASPFVFGGWMSLCVRIKTRTLWSGSITKKLVALAWWLLRKGFEVGKKTLRAFIKGTGALTRSLVRGTGSAIKLLPLMGRTALLTLVYIFLLLLTHFARAHFFFFLLSAGLFAVVVYITLMLMRLQKAIHALAAGEQDISIETKGMPPVLRETAGELGHIRDGITLAVEAQLTSERMKTELITNVSHDIKTPLTSLVSYVDLLQKETDEDKKQEYLAVLDRQSQKLKKLTEDLVELSKSGSGAMVCTPMRRSLRELLRQALGEYEDRFRAAGLECCLQMPEEELFCLADGNLTWRVLDNLLGNACKYAQSGTRLYVVAKEQGENVEVEIKNISREPLNIPASELMERFKRGDASRSSEGSGLGLSIAENLSRLQGGSLHIAIDGDLFKAVYTLRKSS